MKTPSVNDTVAIEVIGKLETHKQFWVSMSRNNPARHALVAYKRSLANVIAAGIAEHYGVAPYISGKNVFSPWTWKKVFWWFEEFTSNFRHDQNNVMKPIEDALVRACVIVDDNETHCVLDPLHPIPEPIKVAKGDERGVIHLRFPDVPCDRSRQMAMKKQKIA